MAMIGCNECCGCQTLQWVHLVFQPNGTFQDGIFTHGCFQSALYIINKDFLGGILGILTKEVQYCYIRRPLLSFISVSFHYCFFLHFIQMAFIAEVIYSFLQVTYIYHIQHAASQQGHSGFFTAILEGFIKNLMCIFRFSIFNVIKVVDLPKKQAFSTPQYLSSLRETFWQATCPHRLCAIFMLGIAEVLLCTFPMSNRKTPFTIRIV